MRNIFCSLLVVFFAASARAASYKAVLVPAFTDQQFTRQSQLLANTSYYYDHVYKWLQQKSYWGFSYRDLPALDKLGGALLDMCDSLIEDAEIEYEATFAAQLSSEKIIRYIDYMVPEKLKKMRVGRAAARVKRDPTPEPTSPSTSPTAPATTAGSHWFTLPSFTWPHLFGTDAPENSTATDASSIGPSTTSTLAPTTTTTPTTTATPTTIATPTTTAAPTTTATPTTTAAPTTTATPTTGAPSTTVAPITTVAPTETMFNTTELSSNTTDPSRNTTDSSWNTTEPSSNTTEPSWNTTEPSWNSTEPSWNTTDGSWNTTEPSWNTTEPSSNTTEPSWNTTESSWNTTEPSWNTTEPSWNTTEIVNVTSTTPDPEIVDPDIPDETGDDEIESAGYWLDLYRREKSRHKLLAAAATKSRKYSESVYELREELREAREALRKERKLKPLIQGVEDLGEKIREALVESLKSYDNLHYYGTMMGSGFAPRRGEARSGLRVKLISARHYLPNLEAGSFFPVHFTQKIVFTDLDTRCDNSSDSYKLCPVSYVKQHRLLTFRVTRDMQGFRQFAQGERVRLDGLAVVMRGVLVNQNVTVEVMNVGDFKDYYAGDTYSYYGGPVNAEAEFQPDLMQHQLSQTMSDRDHRYRAVSTPYTRWVLAIDLEKNDQLDLTNLKAVEVHFRGSANYQFVNGNNNFF